MKLHEDEKALLTSIEGVAAFRLLLPVVRDLALYIAGHGGPPPILKSLPNVRSEVALERRRYRELEGRRQ
jgi:hypothetical protein